MASTRDYPKESFAYPKESFAYPKESFAYPKESSSHIRMLDNPEDLYLLLVYGR
jgi:hypothetical protein